MLAIVLTTLFTCADLCGADAVSHYAELLRSAGYGRLPAERAAFLIREHDGGITMEPWRHSGFQHAVFRGSVPERTIAIVHTHPRSSPNPSPRDREEARRTGLPVVVVTPAAVTAATPEGAVVRIAGHRQWWAKAIDE